MLLNLNKKTKEFIKNKKIQIPTEIINYLVWGFVILILLLKFLKIDNPFGPTVFLDEIIYKNNSLFFFNGSKEYNTQYPPLYSLILSITFVFENWYEIMIYMNAILTSLVLIPVWLLARRYVSKNIASIVVLFSLLLPFQVIYPQYLMSENLSVFLFLIAVLLSLEGTKTSFFRSFLLGFVLGLCFLTKYLFLPVIPVLIIFWFFVNKIENRKNLLKFEQKDWGKLLFVCLGVGIVVLPWVLFVMNMGNNLSKALGLGISGIKESSVSLTSLIKWIIAYLSYLILAIAPVILSITIYCFTLVRNYLRTKNLEKEIIFFGLIFALTGLYWMLAIQHSFGAPYNYPVPQYILGRYLIHLTPLIYIAGIISVQKLFDKSSQFSVKSFLFLTTIFSLFIYLSYWILFKENFFGFSKWFATSIFNSQDVFIYQNHENIIFSLVFFISSAVFLWFLLQKKKTKVGLSVILFIFLLWQLVTFSYASKAVLGNFSGAHGRYIGTTINIYLDGNQFDGYIYYLIPGTSNTQLQYMLSFWGVDIAVENLIDMNSMNDNQSLTNLNGNHIVVISNEYPFNKIGYYNVANQEYKIYQVGEINAISTKISIIDHSSLDEMVAGQPINAQPSGASALWLKTKNVMPTTIVIFNGHELATTIVNSEYLTALLPNEYFSEPGEVEIYLFDKLTGQKSETIIIEIQEAQTWSD